MSIKINTARVFHVGHDDFLIITDMATFRLNKKCPVMLYGTKSKATSIDAYNPHVSLTHPQITQSGSNKTHHFIQFYDTQNLFNEIRDKIFIYLKNQKHTNIIILNRIIAYITPAIQIVKIHNDPTTNMAIDFGNGWWTISSATYEELVSKIEDNFKAVLLSKEIEELEPEPADCGIEL